ncbi:MAG: CrcB family protein [candidate division Zixibacteria bacterium]|nr:CrcB family protein [candidate division Zixibacteria bacterium]
MIQKLIWLALAGAVGTLARYGLAGYIDKFNGSTFPWGTVAVNLIGCFVAGLLWALFENKWPASIEIRTIVLIGFLGAFTTFSTLILESGHLIHSTQWMRAVGNIMMQNGIGFVALFTGMSLGRMV